MSQENKTTKERSVENKSSIKPAVASRKQITSQPRKQRKARYTAQLHQQQKYFHAPLSKDLRLRHGKKNVQVRKGDTVKIMCGQYKRVQGKVETVELKRERLFIEGAHKEKRDGMKAFYPIHPSNVQIISLVLSDKKRKEKLTKKTKSAKTDNTKINPTSNVAVNKEEATTKK
jgi:large subunit ribosomal protein L24